MTHPATVICQGMFNVCILHLFNQNPDSGAVMCFRLFQTFWIFCWVIFRTFVLLVAFAISSHSQKLHFIWLCIFRRVLSHVTLPYPVTFSQICVTFFMSARQFSQDKLSKWNKLCSQNVLGSLNQEFCIFWMILN